MAYYEYKCVNKECEDFEISKSVQIAMSEYSEDKLPVCEKCNEKTQRVFGIAGCKTFGDGYRS